MMQKVMVLSRISIIIQGLLSLRQTLQQEIRNVCSEITEICYDIQHRLGRDVAELRSDSENQLSCLKNRFTQLENQNLNNYNTNDRQRGRQVRNLQHHTEPEHQKGTLSTPSAGGITKLQDEICKTIKTEFSNVRGDLHPVTSELKQVVQSLKSLPTPRAPVSNNYRDNNNQNRNGRGNFSNQPHQQRNQYRGFQDTRSRQQNSTQDTPINGNPQSVQNITRGNGRMSNLGARERHQM